MIPFLANAIRALPKVRRLGAGLDDIADARALIEPFGGRAAAGDIAMQKFRLSGWGHPSAYRKLPYRPSPPTPTITPTRAREASKGPLSKWLDTQIREAPKPNVAAAKMEDAISDYNQFNLENFSERAMAPMGFPFPPFLQKNLMGGPDRIYNTGMANRFDPLSKRRGIMARYTVDPSQFTYMY